MIHRMPEKTTIYHAAAIRDAAGTNLRPGSIAVRRGVIAAVGTPQRVMAQHGERAENVVDLPDKLLLPSFVNAHCHLDLTGLGPRKYTGSFIDWLKTVIADAPRETNDVQNAVRAGIQLSQQAGVGFLGDIAHSLDAAQTRLTSGLPGVTYLEVFGIGEAQDEAIAEMNQRIRTLPHEAPSPGHRRGVLVGLGPHAPYSVGDALYDAVIKLSEQRACRISTHLAETPEEIKFLQNATGPFVDLLKSLGKWDRSIDEQGKHPIDWFGDRLKRGRWLLAHCNYVDDQHIKRLARTGTSVAYCPIASEYFGHENHRYRDMLAAGVNVCLGTDSILCQPPDEPHPLGMLAPMRRLYARDRTDPQTLLAMATINGLRAMEINESEATFQIGAPAHFNAFTIDPSDDTRALEQVLQGTQQLEVIR